LNVSNFVLMAEMGFPIDPSCATTAESSSSSSSELDTSLDFDLSSVSGENDLEQLGFEYHVVSSAEQAQLLLTNFIAGK